MPVGQRESHPPCGFCRAAVFAHATAPAKSKPDGGEAESHQNGRITSINC